MIDKPLEILGDGPVADIEIQARGADALWFNANIGRVANLTFRQAGGEGNWHGVDISQGHLELEGCDISSESLAGVGIRNSADPTLRRTPSTIASRVASSSMTMVWGRWKITTSSPTLSPAYQSRTAATPRCAATYP